MAIATAAILGAAAIGAIGSYLANKSASDRAEMAQNKALQEWIAINIPDPERQKLALEKFVVQGELDPQLEKAIKADPSAFEQIVTSAEQKSSQMRALSELENIGYEGGLRLQDKAALQDSMLEGQVRDRANRDAISADMARRGMGGSGFEVAAQLQGQQSGADRDARNSLSVAAQAQDRALQAIMGAGDLATKYRTQDFGEQSAKAQAEDRINMFNTENLRDVQQRNIGSQNRAAEMNLAQKQSVADKNTQLSNYEQEYNKGLIQKQFDNEAKIAAGKTGQYAAQAQTAVDSGKNLGNLFSNVGGAASGAATTYANQDYWSDYFNKQKKQTG